MARFRYRMQNILDVKEKLENQARNDFAVAAAKVNEEEEKQSNSTFVIVPHFAFCFCSESGVSSCKPSWLRE